MPVSPPPASMTPIRSEPPGPGEPVPPAEARPRRLGLSTTDGALLVALLAAAASWNVLLNGFVWDDNQSILLNRWVREPGRVFEAFHHHLAGYDPRFDTSFYRPMLHVVFAATYALAGLRPWAFHLVNLAAHAAMSACVYLLLVRWAPAAARPGGPPEQPSPGGRSWEPFASGPLVAALLFAVHPVHTQAVAWISGVGEVSYALLFVVAFLWATHEGPRRLVPLVAAPVAFFLALLSKEPAIVLLPVVAVALALRGALSDPMRRRDALLRLGALSAAVLAYLPLRVNALGGLMRATGDRLEVGLEAGAATALVLAAEYLKLLVAPIRLSALRDLEIVPRLLDPRALVAVAVVAAFAGIAWSLRRRAGAMLGTAILVLPLLPALYVPVLGDSAGAERYAYLPSVGAALLLSCAIEAWRGERASAVRLAIAGTAAAALVAATAATLAQNAVWRDEVTLWSDTIEKVPSSWKAHDSLGGALLGLGRLGPAIAALERAVELEPTDAAVRVNLASALVSAGRVDEGLAAAEHGARSLPSVAEAQAILGSALDAKGRLVEAVVAYERALSLNPSLPSVHNHAAIAYARLGRKDRAVVHLREAIRLQPESPIYVENLRRLTGP